MTINYFYCVKPLFILFLSIGLAFSGAQAQNNFDIQIAKLQYEGGGDWYSNPTAVPNLIDFVRRSTNVQLDPEEYLVKPGGTQIFQYPYVYMTGHGNVVFTDEEAKNLRTYLLSGGFLHIDDNYGMDKYVRREMKKVFPDLDFVEVDWEHPIFHQQYDFEKGLPKIHEHDKKPPQGFGIIYENRLVCFYTYECDLGDGWEDANVHNDPPEVREAALKMGANIVIYALNH